MPTSIYCLYIGFDYTYIDINTLAQGIKSFLASQIVFKPLLGLEPMAPIRPQLPTNHANHSATKTSPCIYVFLYVGIYVCMCMYICLHVFVCMYVCMYVCMCVCMYLSIYLYIYIYIYIYTHTHTDTHTHTHTPQSIFYLFECLNRNTSLESVLFAHKPRKTPSILNAKGYYGWW